MCIQDHFVITQHMQLKLRALVFKWPVAQQHAATEQNIEVKFKIWDSFDQ